MAFVLGINAKAFYQSDGVNGVAGWNELTNIRDLKIARETSTADATVRAGNGYKQTVAVLIDSSIEFEMNYDTADAGFTVLEAAQRNGAVVGMKILDGGTESTGTGPVADFMVSKFEIKQANEDLIKVNVSMVVAPGATPTQQNP